VRNKEQKVEKGEKLKVGGKDAEGDDVAMPPGHVDVDKKTFVRTPASRKVQQHVEWGGGGAPPCVLLAWWPMVLAPHPAQRNTTQLIFHLVTTIVVRLRCTW
jgi:hypothetical protein